MVECLVEYDYDAQEEDELTIKKGEVITEVSQMEGGWWEGKLNGKHGAFPDNFVKVIEKEATKKPPVEGAKKDQKSHVAAISDKLGKEGGIRIGPPPPGHGVIKRETKKRRAKVLHSYAPEAEDEIGLDVGDIVEVFKQEEEGWWEGKLNGKVGMFPSNFVEMMEDADESTQGFDEAKEDEKPAPPGEPTAPPTGGNRQSTALSKKPTGGVGLGNIFSDGPVKLRTNRTSNTSAKKPEDTKEPADLNKAHEVADQKKKKLSGRDSNKEPTVASNDSKKTGGRARALYSYTAENEDELTLTEGDVITILDKELEDSGWWQGEVNGKVGVFPDNFVEVIPEERKPPPPIIPPSSTKPGFRERPPPPEPTAKVPARPEKPPAPAPEPVRLRKDEKPAPPLPSNKKPVMPPPISKKPIRTERQTDDDKVKEKEPDELDVIEPTEKLTHHKRPKAPKTRPWSQVMNNQKETEDEQTTTTEHTNNVSESTKTQETKEEPTKRTHSGSTGSPRSPKPTPQKEPLAHTNSSEAPVRPQRPALPDTSEVATLRRELTQLRETTVSKDAYQELRQEVTALKESLTGLKVHFNKRLMELMNEVDEEKKIRLSMQVEVERVRKLAMTTS